MPIAYEEMEGSPTLTVDRKGGKAKRIIRIAWDDIDAAILELFPGARFGYPYNASMPGFPWLRCQSVDIAPFDPNNPRLSANGFTARYPDGGALLTINYAPNEWDDNEQAPGETSNDQVYIEHKTNYSGEMLIWPGQGCRWATDTDGNPIEEGSHTIANTVNEDVRVGVLIPTIEHETTWNFVREPPWRGIRACMGKVNKESFGGAHPETMLFLGASAARTFSTTGFPWWKLTYKFQEKCYNFDLVKKGVEAQGWNHFLRPNGNKTGFARMIRGNKDPIYALVQFRQLFGGAA